MILQLLLKIVSLAMILLITTILLQLLLEDLRHHDVRLVSLRPGRVVGPDLASAAQIYAPVVLELQLLAILILRCGHRFLWGPAHEVLMLLCKGRHCGAKLIAVGLGQVLIRAR